MLSRLLFAPLLALPLPLLAQRPALTLDSARAVARAGHPDVIAAHALARAARAEAVALGRLDNPVLAADRESSGVSGTSASQIIIQVEQPLDIWGRRTGRGDAATLRAAAADVRTGAAAARVQEATTLAFVEAVAADWRVAADARALAAFDRAVRILGERQRAGDASGLDGRRLALERSRALARLAASRHAHHVAMAELAGLLGEAPSALEPVALVMDTLPNFTPATTLDSLRRAAERAPSELLARQLERQAATRNVDAAARARWPVPLLRLGGKWEQFTDAASRSGFVAGISLPLPTWDGGGAALQAAESEADARDAGVEAAKRRLEIELTEAWDGLRDHAGVVAELRRELAEHGDAIHQALEVAFAEGELSLTAWLDAVRSEQETLAIHAELWAELAGRLARLERLTGLDFFRETP
ncbi:MAG: TolC family protein [Gemmatimonadetes bacterium]|nr:TolC family protein [Gemmatimonadota bacterium]MCA9763933.1 TolC family protein [Gemmatimonadota bacterium]MCB9518283.1 TolC family protein [Gemmatimonadales bacterium]HPF62147.1 TolC family protein [Gemmatimonadales bacterium]HRX18156.1 TolC family protein [Gemmatimonadales bacterium]